jgi:hypothetical protein
MGDERIGILAPGLEPSGAQRDLHLGPEIEIRPVPVPGVGFRSFCWILDRAEWTKILVKWPEPD